MHPADEEDEEEMLKRAEEEVCSIKGEPLKKQLGKNKAAKHELLTFFLQMMQRKRRRR